AQGDGQPVSAAGRWALIGGEGAVAGAAAGSCACYRDFAGFLAAVRAGGLVHEVAVVPCDSPAGGLAAAARSAVHAALAVLQSWLAEEDLAGIRLVFLTR